MNSKIIVVVLLALFGCGWAAPDGEESKVAPIIEPIGEIPIDETPPIKYPPIVIDEPYPQVCPVCESRICASNGVIYKDWCAFSCARSKDSTLTPQPSLKYCHRIVPVDPPIEIDPIGPSFPVDTIDVMPAE